MGHDITRRNHRHVDLGQVPGQPFVLIAKPVAVWIDQRDRLHPAGNIDPAFAGAHALGGEGDGLQPRGTFSVDRDAGHRDRQPGTQRRLARDIGADRTFCARRAQQDILNLVRLHAGPLDGCGDHMRRHAGAMDSVERTAMGLCDRQTDRGDDGGFLHDQLQKLCAKAHLGPMCRHLHRAGGCHHACDVLPPALTPCPAWPKSRT